MFMHTAGFISDQSVYKNGQPGFSFDTMHTKTIFDMCFWLHSFENIIFCDKTLSLKLLLPSHVV